MLLFTANSPVGHHIHLCSMVPCVFGEEDIVLPNLEKVFVTITTGAIFPLRETNVHCQVLNPIEVKVLFKNYLVCF